MRTFRLPVFSSSTFLVAVVVVTMAVVVTPAWALTAEQEAKLVASDGASGANFGFAVAVDGDTAVIGARSDDDNGSTYVFTRTGGVWTEQAKLVASDGAPGANFGFTAAVDGDTAVIGAPNSNSAYVFTRSAGVWTEQAKLLASDGVFGSFGRGVAIDGDTALIGNNRDDDNGEHSGSTYVFTRTGGVWTEQAKLVASDGEAWDAFGWSVALDGDTAIIGAHQDFDNNIRTGSAYVFTRTGGVWTEWAKLLSSDGEYANQFGLSVALDGNTAIIGAASDNDNGSLSGSAYAFARTGGVWTEQAKLLASDGAAEDVFGISVALDGDTAVIGAYFDDDNGSLSGSAYVFARTGGVWTEQAKLLASDAAASNAFGMGVALDGDTAIIGATGNDNNNGPYSGSAYVFRLGPDDSDGDGIDDDQDVCADTIIPESVPTNHLGVNRWALVGRWHVRHEPASRRRWRTWTSSSQLQDTAGCSCEQIIEAMALGWGHTKFGCSTGAMLQWIAGQSADTT